MNRAPKARLTPPSLSLGDGEWGRAPRGYNCPRGRANMMTETPEPATDAPAVPAGYDGPRACTWHELASAVDLANLVLRGAGRATGRTATLADHRRRLRPRLSMATICPTFGSSHIAGRVVSSVGIYPTEVRTPRGAISVGGYQRLCHAPRPPASGPSARAVLRDAHDSDAGQRPACWPPEYADSGLLPQVWLGERRAAAHVGL